MTNWWESIFRESDQLIYDRFVNEGYPYFLEMDASAALTRNIPAVMRSMPSSWSSRRSYLNTPRKSGWTGFRTQMMVMDEWYPHPPIRYRDGGWPIDVKRFKYDEEYRSGLKSMILFRLELQGELQRGLYEEMDKQILWGDGLGNSEFRGFS